MAFLSKYNTARHIYIPVIKRAAVDFAVGADWTPAAGDVKVSKDGAAAANVTNLPTAIAMGNGAIWDFSMTATELQAAQVVVTVSDSATKAVEDQSFIIETYGNASAQHVMDLSQALPTNFSTLAIDASGRVDLSKVGGSAINALISGRIDANAQVVGDKTGYSLTQAFPSNFSSMSIDTNGRIKVQATVQKNVALSNFMFLMTDSTTHAPKTGVAVSVNRSIDGAAFAAGTLSAVTEVSNGWYRVDFGSGDLNGSVIVLKATGSGSDDTEVSLYTFA